MARHWRQWARSKALSRGHLLKGEPARKAGGIDLSYPPEVIEDQEKEQREKDRAAEHASGHAAGHALLHTSEHASGHAAGQRDSDEDDPLIRAGRERRGILAGQGGQGGAPSGDTAAGPAGGAGRTGGGGGDGGGAMGAASASQVLVPPLLKPHSRNGGGLKDPLELYFPHGLSSQQQTPRIAAAGRGTCGTGAPGGSLLPAPSAPLADGGSDSLDGPSGGKASSSAALGFSAALDPQAAGPLSVRWARARRSSVPHAVGATPAAFAARLVGPSPHAAAGPFALATGAGALAGSGPWAITPGYAFSGSAGESS